ncbi:PduM family microcompartment protein [Lentilactobacillus sp. Marseille-Q4993]|uniref:PduM family microcompartment protein n=1 Tax=Lentilactobacillus sp. Marseille-Q4993 TaxID=3039492 RepID=UPI0024BD5B9E|nr:PduM family microcompartment protein [Lentilactobacillus sp. Marseille-Q4993]
MNQVDEIIEKVVQRIQQRNHQQKALSFHSDDPSPDDDLFIENSSITIDGITINLILDLYRANQQNAWVDWILKGISYDVHFYFQISKNMVNFIPRKMLLDWPIDFVVGTDSLVWSTHSQVINRGELARIPDNSILIMNPKQRFTEEARDLIGLKQLVLQERTDEDCIWQK